MHNKLRFSVVLQYRDEGCIKTEKDSGCSAMQALTNTRLHVHHHELNRARALLLANLVANLKTPSSSFDLQEICVDLQTPPIQKTLS